VSLYSTVDVATSLPLKVPAVTTIFGQRYLQQGDEGVAAYHFDSPDDVYISYANAPSGWTHDDGSPPPEKKIFTDCSFDPGTRTFRGTIRWDESPFNGDSSWDYEMVFSENFAIIEGGRMQATKAGGGAGATHKFPMDLCYWRGLPPLDDIAGQTYIQGGTVGQASYHYEDMSKPYISYSSAPPQWALDDGAAPPSKKYVREQGETEVRRERVARPNSSSRYFDEAQWFPQTRTFTGTITWSPTSFGGDAMW
jgi:hypothetical protein